LVLGLYGHEHTHFIYETKDDNGNVSTSHKYGNFDIIRLENAIAEFPDGPPLPGTWTYPFSIELPDWLPPSFAYFGDTIAISYEIYSQFVPVNESDW